MTYLYSSNGYVLSRHDWQSLSRCFLFRCFSDVDVAVSESFYVNSTDVKPFSFAFFPGSTSCGAETQ